MITLGAAGGSEPAARNNDVILLIPAQPAVVQPAIEIAAIRPIRLVAFRDRPGDKPRLHIWTGTKWHPLDFDDFCSLRFVDQLPKTAIIIGDDSIVPRVIRQDLAWPCRIERLPTLAVLSEYFHFNPSERKELAAARGLEMDDAAAAQTQQENPAGQADKSGRGGTDGKTAAEIFNLRIGEKEYISFIWIAPLAMWVGRDEVTNAQYSRFNRAHDPKRYYNNILDMPDQPAAMVSWEDANNYCGWLNRNFQDRLPPGFACRLPTEQEWLVFADCGLELKYPWGNQWPPPDSFNYKGVEGAGMFYGIFHDEKFIAGHNDGFIVSAPVDKSGTNAWGLYGVGGNVWEWCQNWFDETKTARALRGAAWNNHDPEILAVNYRSSASPDKNNAMIGFRVVMAPYPFRAAPRGPAMRPPPTTGSFPGKPTPAPR
jgi:formylglycine-generating enzyme required for sulfatase activity